MRTPEGYEKAEICKYLDSIGAWYIKPMTFGYGKSGTPDILALVRGRFITIEVKREGKEPTVLQQKRISEIEEAGGFAYWGTAERVIMALKEAARTWL